MMNERILTLEQFVAKWEKRGFKTRAIVKPTAEGRRLFCGMELDVPKRSKHYREKYLCNPPIDLTALATEKHAKAQQGRNDQAAPRSDDPAGPGDAGAGARPALRARAPTLTAGNRLSGVSALRRPKA